jgi:hypothetical protein
VDNRYLLGHNTAVGRTSVLDGTYARTKGSSASAERKDVGQRPVRRGLDGRIHFCVDRSGFVLEEEATQMEKPKRSYYLPTKLVSAFDRECSKSGYVKEKVVAAAMLSFLDSNPELRSTMFEKLDVFLKGKKQR